MLGPLAFGSLIDDPGSEIESIVVERTVYGRPSESNSRDTATREEAPQHLFRFSGPVLHIQTQFRRLVSLFLDDVGSLSGSVRGTYP
jgi:hypothetical protein